MRWWSSRASTDRWRNSAGCRCPLFWMAQVANRCSPIPNLLGRLPRPASIPGPCPARVVPWDTLCARIATASRHGPSPAMASKFQIMRPRKGPVRKRHCGWSSRPSRKSRRNFSVVGKARDIRSGIEGVMRNHVLPPSEGSRRDARGERISGKSLTKFPDGFYLVR